MRRLASTSSAVLLLVLLWACAGCSEAPGAPGPLASSITSASSPSGIPHQTSDVPATATARLRFTLRLSLDGGPAVRVDGRIDGEDREIAFEMGAVASAFGLEGDLGGAAGLVAQRVVGGLTYVTSPTVGELTGRPGEAVWMLVDDGATAGGGSSPPSNAPTSLLADLLAAAGEEVEPAELAMAVEAILGSVLPGGEQVAVTVEVSELPAGETITAPAEADVLSSAELGELLGSASIVDPYG